MQPPSKKSMIVVLFGQMYASLGVTETQSNYPFIFI